MHLLLRFCFVYLYSVSGLISVINEILRFERSQTYVQITYETLNFRDKPCRIMEVIQRFGKRCHLAAGSCSVRHNVG